MPHCAPLQLSESPLTCGYSSVMVEFMSGRIATQAWGRSPRCRKIPVDQAVQAPERFRQRGQVEKEGVGTLSGRAIAFTLHDAQPTSLSGRWLRVLRGAANHRASWVIDETHVHQCGST